VILGISVLIWALMSFPGMPSDQAAMWDDRIRAAENEEVRMKLSAEKARAGLAHSAAGRMGRALTHVTAPLGFDWRTNVALVGGFAAKEVVVSTLGTAYSIGEVDAAESEGLSTDGVCSLLCHGSDDPAGNGQHGLGAVFHCLHHRPRLCIDIPCLSGRQAGWSSMNFLRTIKARPYVLSFARPIRSIPKRLHAESSKMHATGRGVFLS